MSLPYIRKKYNVPAKQNSWILYKGGRKPIKCQIKSGSRGYLRVVSIDGKRFILHPTWKIKYL